MKQMEFVQIDPVHDRDILLNFRRDSFVASFGHDHNFDGEAYLQWVQTSSAAFPDGFVFAKWDDTIIGQLELQIKETDTYRFGYMNLIYLTKAFRNKGFGQTLMHYAENEFFRKHHVQEYRLRVSSTNSPAIRFYEKHGFVKDREDKPGLWVFVKKIG